MDAEFFNKYKHIFSPSIRDFYADKFGIEDDYLSRKRREAEGLTNRIEEQGLPSEKFNWGKLAGNALSLLTGGFTMLPRMAAVASEAAKGDLDELYPNIEKWGNFFGQGDQGGGADRLRAVRDTMFNQGPVQNFSVDRTLRKYGGDFWKKDINYRFIQNAIADKLGITNSPANLSSKEMIELFRKVFGKLYEGKNPGIVPIDKTLDMLRRLGMDDEKIGKVLSSKSAYFIPGAGQLKAFDVANNVTYEMTRDPAAVFSLVAEELLDASNYVGLGGATEAITLSAKLAKVSTAKGLLDNALIAATRGASTAGSSTLLREGLELAGTHTDDVTKIMRYVEIGSNSDIDTAFKIINNLEDSKILSSQKLMKPVTEQLDRFGRMAKEGRIGLTDDGLRSIGFEKGKLSNSGFMNTKEMNERFVKYADDYYGRKGQLSFGEVDNIAAYRKANADILGEFEAKMMAKEIEPNILRNAFSSGTPEKYISRGGIELMPFGKKTGKTLLPYSAFEKIGVPKLGEIAARKMPAQFEWISNKAKILFRSARLAPQELHEVFLTQMQFVPPYKMQQEYIALQRMREKFDLPVEMVDKNETLLTFQIAYDRSLKEFLVSTADNPKAKAPTQEFFTNQNKMVVDNVKVQQLNDELIDVRNKIKTTPKVTPAIIKPQVVDNSLLKQQLTGDLTEIRNKIKTSKIKSTQVPSDAIDWSKMKGKKTKLFYERGVADKVKKPVRTDFGDAGDFVQGLKEWDALPTAMKGTEAKPGYLTLSKLNYWDADVVDDIYRIASMEKTGKVTKNIPNIVDDLLIQEQKLVSQIESLSKQTPIITPKVTPTVDSTLNNLLTKQAQLQNEIRRLEANPSKQITESIPTEVTTKVPKVPVVEPQKILKDTDLKKFANSDWPKQFQINDMMSTADKDRIYKLRKYAQEWIMLPENNKAFGRALGDKLKEIQAYENIKGIPTPNFESPFGWYTPGVQGKQGTKGNAFRKIEEGFPGSNISKKPGFKEAKTWENPIEYIIAHPELKDSVETRLTKLVNNRSNESIKAVATADYLKHVRRFGVKDDILDEANKYFQNRKARFGKNVSAKEAIQRARLDTIEKHGFDPTLFNKKISSGVGGDDIHGLLEGYNFTPEVTEYLTVSSQFFADKNINGLIQVMKTFNRWWKSFATVVVPGFHARNAQSNLFNMFLADGSSVFSPELHRHTIAAMSGVDGEFYHPVFQRTVKYSELLDEAGKRGTFDLGLIGEDISTLETKHFMDTPDFWERVRTTGNLASVKGPLVKYGTKLGSVVENEARLALFLDNWMKFGDADHAAKVVSEHLFNYRDITNFDNAIMKTFIPFWTWSKKNVPLQWKNLIRQPRKFGVFAHVKDYMTNISEDPETNEIEGYEFEPDYIKELFGVPTPFKTPTGTRMVYNPNFAFQDLGKITWRDWAAGLTPLAKIPLELMSNKEIFTGAPIKSPGSSGLKEAPLYMDWLRKTGIPFPGVHAGKGYEGEDITMLNTYLDYAMKQIPLAGNIGRAMPQSERMKEKSPLKLLSMLAGIKFFEYNPETAEYWALKDRIERLEEMKDYYRKTGVWEDEYAR